MTSAARVAANRRNAGRSSGPRTIRGKARAARNALRHGLAMPQSHDGDFVRRLEALTQAVRAATGAPRPIAAAIAEARLELLRARQATVEMLKAALREQSTSEAGLDPDTRIGLAFAAKAPQLARLARYDRRAWSRLKTLCALLEKSGDAQASISTAPGSANKANRLAAAPGGGTGAKRLRPQDLAGADIVISAFEPGDQSETPASTGASANEAKNSRDRAPAASGPAHRSPKPAPSAARELTAPKSTGAKPFGWTDLKIPLIGSSSSAIEVKLRRGALRWRLDYVRQLGNPELSRCYEMGLAGHIWQLTEIARKLIRHGHVNVAISELDAGLMIFPRSALLNALRACAGMIANRPSGPKIFQRYRGKSVNGMRWEELVFDQLHRVRRAPGAGIKLIGDVETILGCAQPSARERRKVRISILHAAPGMFQTSIDDKAEEARQQSSIAAPSVASHPPIAASGFLIANSFRNSGDYHRALRFYFLRLDRCLIPPLPRLKEACDELSNSKAYALCCISQVAWRLLNRGDFEPVLSAADRALMIFPDSGKSSCLPGRGADVLRPAG